MTIDNENVAHESLIVRSADTDRFYRATIPFIFASCQEVAGEHATLRGMEIQKLNKEEHCTWIVSRTKISFEKIPSWRDALSITTFPLEGWHLLCPRYIEAVDQNGEKVFSAMTHWIVMDTERKRPVRPQIIGKRLVVPEIASTVSPDIGKIVKFDTHENAEMLPVFEPGISWYDTDYNRHINNVVYTRWVTEALPEETLNDYEIKEIDVQWESQTFAGDSVYVETALVEKTGDTLEYAQRIRRHEKDGEDTTLFEANSVWKKK